MEFDNVIIASLVAAVAALVAARHAAKAANLQAREDKKGQLFSKSVEIKYQRKSELYVEAFAITDKLSKRFILIKDSPISQSYFEDVKNELLRWESKCGMVFEQDTLKAYRALLQALSASPKTDGYMSRDSKNEVWRKRAWLRGCLKAELDPKVDATRLKKFLEDD